MIVGMTSGTFDLFHHSHLLYLERCKSQCDKLIVGVDSDDRVRFSKGVNRPIFSEIHRCNLIQAISFVDMAFILRSLNDLTQIAQSFNVSKVFKCEVWRGKHVFGAEKAELVILEDIPGMISTSTIVEAIKNGKTCLGPIPEGVS